MSPPLDSVSFRFVADEILGSSSTSTDDVFEPVPMDVFPPPSSAPTNKSDLFSLLAYRRWKSPPTLLNPLRPPEPPDLPSPPDLADLPSPSRPPSFLLVPRSFSSAAPMTASSPVNSSFPMNLSSAHAS
ncbi:unnamed protein product [Arabis nemorensis]|uniref:Uncharacterized protein n=1 Tax=Arabis nemorensis TaxID=586526 RepID=A0A565AXP1_9BRAS|nr:unnamed protein product [Arabis nemorensis]